MARAYDSVLWAPRLSLLERDVERLEDERGWSLTDPVAVGGRIAADSCRPATPSCCWPSNQRLDVAGDRDRRLLLAVVLASQFCSGCRRNSLRLGKFWSWRWKERSSSRSQAAVVEETATLPLSSRNSSSPICDLDLRRSGWPEAALMMPCIRSAPDWPWAYDRMTDTLRSISLAVIRPTLAQGRGSSCIVAKMASVGLNPGGRGGASAAASAGSSTRSSSPGRRKEWASWRTCSTGSSSSTYEMSTCFFPESIKTNLYGRTDGSFN